MWIKMHQDRFQKCEAETHGMKEGKLVVQLREDSWCWRHGTIIHEFMHVLGFFHEQQRVDRDNFVVVDDVPKGRAFDFKTTRQLGYDIPLIGKYDYASVMHYPRKSGGRLVLTAKNDPVEDNNAAMGNRIYPSEGDVFKINTFYRDECSARIAMAEELSGGNETDPSQDESDLSYQDDEISRLLSQNLQNETDLVVPPDNSTSPIVICNEHEFRCSGQCYSLDNLGNGRDDCSDGSDEIYGPLCPANHFRCPGPGLGCFQMEDICDGDRDCDDGSDERLCPSWNASTEVISTSSTDMSPLLLRQAKRQLQLYLLNKGYIGTGLGSE